MSNIETANGVSENGTENIAASGADKPVTEGKSLRTVMVVAAVSAVVGVTLPAIANLKLQPAKSEKQLEASVETPSQTRIGALSEAEYLEAFVWVARGKLEDLGIHHTLSVKVSGPNHIEISGNIAESFSGRYELFKHWFNNRENFPELQDKVQKVEVFGAIPGVKSVWLGEKQLAFFDDGSSGGVGAMIGEGWEILKIDQLEIVLQREGTVVAVEY